MSKVLSADSKEKAFTLRSAIIGAVGSAILTASSLFIALKMGALPWPIVFAVLASVMALKVFGSTNLHEANVCHAAMSAGAMIAGGLAFTIPGLWIIAPEIELSFADILFASLAGTCMGLIVSAVLQNYFIRNWKLAYPIGTSAADTLKASAFDEKKNKKNTYSLFGAMGLGGIYAFLRDNLGLLPANFGAGTFSVMNSPMMISVGFIVGVVPVAVWFLGAVLSHVGIGIVLPSLGVIGANDVASWQTSLGLGLMLGVGAGVIVLGVIPLIKKYIKSSNKSEEVSDAEVATSDDKSRLKMKPLPIALVMAAVMLIVTICLKLNVVTSIILILGAWFCGYLSAWLTGTTGINPMEIFGVLILLLVRTFTADMSMASLFIVAAVIAVACGIVGDLMNDFKAGDIIGTHPKDQFFGEIIGGFIGAVVASILLMVLYKSYGASSFGPGTTFVSAQASVVASMVGGISQMPVFIAGLIIGFVLAILKLPVMTLGLGVYLPFYISAAAGVGALIRLIVDKVMKKKHPEKEDNSELGQVIASGVLGGESLVGVFTSIALLVGMML